MIARDIRSGRVYGDGNGNAFEVLEIRADACTTCPGKKFTVLFKVVASVDDNLRLNQAMGLSMPDFLKWVKDDLGAARLPCLHTPLTRQAPKEPGWYLAFVPGLTPAPLMVNLVADGSILRPANSQFVLEGGLPIFWSRRIEFRLLVDEKDTLVKQKPIPKPPDAAEPLPPAPPSVQLDNFEPPPDPGSTPVQ